MLRVAPSFPSPRVLLVMGLHNLRERPLCSGTRLAQFNKSPGDSDHTQALNLRGSRPTMDPTRTRGLSAAPQAAWWPPAGVQGWGQGGPVSGAVWWKGLTLVLRESSASRVPGPAWGS